MDEKRILARNVLSSVRSKDKEYYSGRLDFYLSECIIKVSHSDEIILNFSPNRKQFRKKYNILSIRLPDISDGVINSICLVLYSVLYGFMGMCSYKSMGKIYTSIYSNSTRFVRCKVRYTPNIPIGELTHFSNSCYADSVLMILLFGKCPLYKKHMFRDTPNVKYIASLDHNTFDNESDKQEFVEGISVQLRDVYTSLITEENPIKCVDFRKSMRRLLPDTHVHGRYVFYEIVKFYEGLSSLFYDIQSVEDIHVISDFIMKEKFIPKPTTRILVFTNSMNPHFLRLGDMSDEKTGGYELIPDEYVTVTRVSTDSGKKETVQVPAIGYMESIYPKHRVISEYILDYNFELFGICINHSVNHYTSATKFDDGVWRHFDDMSDELEIIDDISDFFTEKGSTIPEMFFYRKIGS